jgi:hypothetical protein
MRAALASGFFSRFFGRPEHVAAALIDLEGLGIERVQLAGFAPETYEALAPVLLGR